MKTILNFLLIFLLIHGTAPQTNASVNTQHYRAFHQSDVISLNKYKNTHALAEAALIHTQYAPLREEIKKVLLEKAQPVSPFRLRGKSIEFKLNQNTYIFQHVRDSQFSLNGQILDLQKEDWYKKLLKDSSSASLWENLTLPKAYAGVPAVIGIIVIISVVGCIGATALDSFKKTMAKATEKLKPENIFKSPEEFNKSMTAVEQEVCGTLSCCASASTATNKVDHSGFFKEACKMSPKNFDENKNALFTKYKFDENNKYFLESFIDDNPDYLPACRMQSLNQSVIDYGEKLQNKSTPPTAR